MPDLERSRGLGHGGPRRGYKWADAEPGNTLAVRSGFWSSPMLRDADREEVEEIAASVRELMPIYKPEFEIVIEQFAWRLWRQRRAYRDLSEHGVVRDGQPAPCSDTWRSSKGPSPATSTPSG